MQRILSLAAVIAVFCLLTTGSTPAADKQDTERKAGNLLELELKGVKWKFHWCPAGTFMMGDNDCYNATPHKVTLAQGFYMAETECTQEQWEAITESNPSNFKGAKLPVENVSWNDCQDFITKLNSQNASPAGYKFSLPTEAQWEYACRAGTTAQFNFGSALNGDKANCDGNYPYGTSTKGKYLGKTSSVGSYPANAWGLYDMHGNVWEWCEDWYEKDYPKGNVVDPTGALSGSRRVRRGGGWYFNAEYCRSACRSNSAPESRGYSLGLRVALVKVRSVIEEAVIQAK